MERSSTTLFAPWRIDYIRSLDTSGGDPCFICAAAATTTDEQRRNMLVLWLGQHTVVMINRYPYTNGHLLVAPRAHKADLEELTPAEQADLVAQTTACTRLLKRAMSAQGFNIGINLGKCAGAGLPGHVHQHVVPRWAGDTNFMGVVGEVRVVPQAMGQLYGELSKLAQDLGMAARP
jgi:ATP adenylyltransferase